MGLSAFQQGAVVLIDDQPHSLLRKISDSLWQIQEERTKRIREMTDEEMRALYVGGRLIFAVSDLIPRSGDRAGQAHQDIPPDLFEVAKVKRAYVHAILDRSSTAAKVAPAVAEVWAKLKMPPTPPHPITVMRWKVLYLASGRDIKSLVPKVSARGNRRSRYPKELTDIISDVISDIYMSLERKSIQDVVERAIIRVERENQLRPEAMRLPRPTRRLISRLINEIPAFDRYCARHGRTAALNKFRSVQGHRITARPLERCEVDHSPLDQMVVDDNTFLPLGRPYLTACIDDFTRCVLGIFIGFEPPSYLTVANCLRDAFLPKTSLNETYPNVANPWVPHGVSRELVVDNGAEFHSHSFEQLCFSLGIEIHYAPRKTGWFKAKIERFLGSANRGIAHGNPGTTFSNILDRGDYDPSKHAVIRLSTLQELVRIWINDYYHQKPHRTLGMPPVVAWSTNIRPEDVVIPSNPADLEAVLGRSESRRLSHKGIELDGLLYNSQELADLRYQLGERLTVDVRVNDADLGKIIVFSPDKTRRFEARCLSYQYASGLSRWQHKVCKRFAAKHLETYDPMSWLTAKETIARLIQEEFAHKRRKTATKLARYQGGKSASKHVGDHPDPNASYAPPMAAPVAKVPGNTSGNDQADNPQPKKRRLKPVLCERVAGLPEAEQAPEEGHD